MNMEDQVLAYIKERNLLSRGSRVMAAVSGGPDSLALMHFLHRYKETLGIELSVITVDHQLRGNVSAEDSLYVKALCNAWQIPCTMISVDVAAYKKEHKLGTEVAARECRYEAFRTQMIKENANYLAFGHHADDQIETVLMAVTRTAHDHNLTGIPDKRPFAGGEIIRPFLCMEQTAIHAYIEKYGLKPRIDASNFEKNYMRNRMRADVVPLLKRENPNLAVTINKLTERLQENEVFLLAEAEKAFDQCVQKENKKGRVNIRIDMLETYPVSLQRKVFRLILDYLYHTLPEQLSYKHEEMFFALVREDKNRRVNLPEELVAERAYDLLYLYFSGEDDTGEPIYLELIPEKIHLPDGSILSSSEVTAGEAEKKVNDPYTYIFSSTSVRFPLVIRTREDGDRLTYDGLRGTKKLKKVFIDEKVPRLERASWPILTDAAGEILWVIGLKKNTKRLPSAATYTCIEIQKKQHR